MWDYLFECVGEDSELCGEQFLVECDSLEEACAIADSNFPNEDLHYYGKFSPEEAEILGLDTY